MDDEEIQKKQKKTEKKLEKLRKKLNQFLLSSDSDKSESESEEEVVDIESEQPSREAELKAMTFTELRELVKKMNKGCKVGGAGVTKDYLISAILKEDCDDDMKTKVKAKAKVSPQKASPQKSPASPKEESEESSSSKSQKKSPTKYSKEELGELETSELKTIATQMGIKIPVGKGRSYIMSAILEGVVDSESKVSKATSPKASSPKASSPKASSPKASSPKASSKSKSLEDMTAAELKEMLVKKGITKNIPLSKKERIELLEAEECDPDNQLFCTDGKACHVENRICVHDKGDKFAKVLSRTVINGKIVIGDKKVIDELKARMEAKPSYQESVPEESESKEVEIKASQRSEEPESSKESSKESEIKSQSEEEESESVKEEEEEEESESVKEEEEEEESESVKEEESDEDSDEESELKSVDEGEKKQATKRDIVMRLSRELRNCLFPTAKKV